MARVENLHPEYRRDGFALHTGEPRLSWILDGVGPGILQTAYEVEAVDDFGGIETAMVESLEQVLVDWPFAELGSRDRRAVRVRAQLSDGSQTAWSEPLQLEVALLDDADWSESFVSPSLSAPAEGVRPGYLLRNAFSIEGEVVAARLYATAHGIYALEINGERVGDQELAPGWTSYLHRLRFQTYDVTKHLQSGANAIGAQLSDGWYRGRIGFHGGIWDNYGRDLALLAQLELTRADGSVEVVPLTSGWRWSVGPVVAASLYDGETYDARREIAGWNLAEFDASAWAHVTVIHRDQFTGRLEPAIGEPVRVTQELRPVSIDYRENGRIRLDFGQNIAGRLSINAPRIEGSTIRLHHAEVLEDDELAIRTLRSAPSIDSFTSNGRSQRWTPTFTIHGFRYAELEGWDGELDEDDVRALVIHSDMTRRGWLETDVALLNQLHENTVWSMRDNFVDLPTDCPQRDERLGWTGDIQVFAPAASYLYDSAGTLASWLLDVGAEQGADGWVPNFVPWIECGFPRGASAAWGDAATVVPWTMYERNGDRGIVEQQYASMTAWVDHSAAKRAGDGLIRTGMELGDWLDPAAPPEDPGAGRTDAYLVANAYLIRSAHIAAQAAELLGEVEDAHRYASVAEDTRRRFRAEYLTADGELLTPTPTALSVVIAFDLLSGDDEVRRAGEVLSELVREGGFTVQTGFVGTPIICDALAAAGQVEVAYRLLLEQACPSWLYPVTMGATTIWERWDSMLPDGTVNPGEMTSFNHYALGAVVDFLHRVVAGLAPAAPGYRRLRIAPRPSLALGRAAADLDTPYGRAASRWERTGDQVELEVVVPAGVTAIVVLPDFEHEVGSGVHRFQFVMETERATV